MYSIVIPVYNSEKSLTELYQRIRNVFEQTIKEPFEIILVDDSSRDRSYDVMLELHQGDSRVKIVQLARNYGQHAALLCGFRHATGDYVITMDDDLQHRPEELPKMITYLKDHPAVDVVIGKYDSKKHGVIRNLGTYVMNKISSHIFHKNDDLQLTSFRLMRKFVVKAMLDIHVNFPRIGHLLLMVSNRIVNVTVEHDERKFGKSGYSFGRLVKDFINNIITNSALPLIIMRNIGIGSFLLSIVLGIIYLIRYFAFGVSVQGWTTLILISLLFFGLILLTLGIVGEYLMRILDEAKKMPNFVERESRGFEGNE